MNPSIKPGYKSTEFWIAMLSTILGFLTVSGIISPEDYQNLNSSGRDSIQSTFTAIANAAIVIGYIHKRTNLKEKHLLAVTAAIETPVAENTPKI